MAISSTAIAQVRTDGNDSNGGFYTSGGTDYSQQASPQLIVDGATYTATVSGTTITTDAPLTSALIGNGCQVLSGTGVTQGFYEITAINVGAGTITLDRSTSGSGVATTFRIGGALATWGQMAVFLNTLTNGGKVCIKTGTYTMTSTSANVSGGRVNITVSGNGTASILIEGYESTPGDGCPTASFPTLVNTTSTSTLFATTNRTEVRCLKVNANSQSTTCFSSNSNGSFYFCHATNINNGTGFQINNQGSALLCSVDTQSFGSGFSIGNATAVACRVKNGNNGQNFAGGDGATFLWCVAQGGNTTCFSTNNLRHCHFINCVAYGSTGTGFYLNVGNTGGVARAINCISVNCTTGFTASGGPLYGHELINCAGYGGTTLVHSSITRNTGFISLTGDPFVDATNGNFALNSTAGAGAAVRATGTTGIAWPTSFAYMSTLNYADLGIAQAAPSGGVSAARLVNRV